MANAQANGIRLEYTISGDLDNPVILLIRGLGTQLTDWSDAFIDALIEQKLAVLMFDNRDVGLSEKVTQAYSLTDMADDAVGLLDALGVERAHVFGISLGGMVAQLVAYQYPHRVHSLFSVMSTSGNPALPPMPEAARRRLMAPAPAGGLEDVIKQTADDAVFYGSPGYPEPLALRLQRARRAHERCYYPKGVSQQMQAVLADGSRVERLQQIAVPTLVIHGAEDPLVEPHAGEDTAVHIPCAQFQLVPGMGHNIPDALATNIAERVAGFIAQITR